MRGRMSPRHTVNLHIDLTESLLHLLSVRLDKPSHLSKVEPQLSSLSDKVQYYLVCFSLSSLFGWGVMARNPVEFFIEQVTERVSVDVVEME